MHRLPAAAILLNLTAHYGSPIALSLPIHYAVTISTNRCWGSYEQSHLWTLIRHHVDRSSLTTPKYEGFIGRNSTVVVRWVNVNPCHRPRWCQWNPTRKESNNVLSPRESASMRSPFHKTTTALPEISRSFNPCHGVQWIAESSRS